MGVALVISVNYLPHNLNSQINKSIAYYIFCVLKSCLSGVKILATVSVYDLK